MNRRSDDTPRYRFATGLAVALAGALLSASCGVGNSNVEANSVTGSGASATTLAKVRRAIGVGGGSSSRSVTLPVGTVLHLQLRSAVASDTSDVEDIVVADVTKPVVISGRDVVPAGATVSGVVSEADDAGRVKGRAQLVLEFTALHTGGTQYDIQTSGFSRTAAATKSEDATKIGVGAGVGAAIGAILGGKKGAAQGAAVGGGAGTGVVLATRGREVRLASGSDVTTRLTVPLTVRLAN